MTTPNYSEFKAPRHHRGRHRNNGTGGIILIIIGIIFLLRTMDLQLPRWLFSWEMILIIIGLAIGAKHRFRNITWVVLVTIGGVFMAADLFDFNIDLRRFIWPVAIIGIGILVLLRSRNRKCMGELGFHETEHSTEDVLNSTVVFSGIEKTIHSKSFRGGQSTVVFGGAEYNFVNADIDGTITLDLVQVFGGSTLIVPPNWDVKMETNTIFGGLEDKRPLTNIPAETNKILLLKGTVIFGGIELKSY
jgi:predicted membrane protein